MNLKTMLLINFLIYIEDLKSSGNEESFNLRYKKINVLSYPKLLFILFI